MIILITGVPGAGKTLNAIKLINEDDNFKNRPRFYFNVRGFNDDSFKELDKESALNWFNLPDHSLIFIDECQSLFPPRATGSKVPESVSQMNTHRHKGIDIILVTQHPTNIDAGLRKLVGRHIHFERPFGSSRVRSLEWQRCVNDPFDDFHQRKEALVKLAKLDKKYFHFYNSAEVHTHKFRVPPKLYLVGVLSVVIVFFGYRFLTGFGSDPVSNTDKPAIVVTDDPVPIHSKKPAVSYVESLVPRVPGFPHTAPIYDQVYKVQSFPRPQCMYWHRTGDCRCFTQQATAIDTPYDICLDIVKKGYFDPTKPDSARQASGTDHRSA